jgi:hypothetical protein
MFQSTPQRWGRRSMSRAMDSKKSVQSTAHLWDDGYSLYALHQAKVSIHGPSGGDLEQRL